MVGTIHTTSKVEGGIEDTGPGDREDREGTVVETIKEVDRVKVGEDIIRTQEDTTEMATRTRATSTQPCCGTPGRS